MKWFFLFTIFFSLMYFFTPKKYTFYSEIPNGSEETHGIAPLLTQRFTYLGEGSQIYAFLSEDKTTVLKLFKARHEKPFKFSRYIRSSKDWEQSHQKWKIKFQDTCRRYKTAFVYLREETGLFYLHFQKTPIPLPTKLDGKVIDLAKFPFILQKYAILAPKYIQKHPEGVQALKDFFTLRTKKGFSDPRQSLSINYGFINDQPIQIDPGKIEFFEGNQEEEIRKIHAHVEKWASTL